MITVAKPGERQKCIVMTRVNGWYVDKKASNPGKQAEYADRVNYDNKERWTSSDNV